MIICSICMEIFAEDCVAYVTFCGHIFHSNCLSRSLNSSSNCPTCRKPCGRSTITTSVGYHRIYLSFDSEYEPKIKRLTDEVASLKLQLSNAEQRGAALAVNRDSYTELELDVAKVENLSLMEENEALHRIIILAEADLKEKKEIITAMNSILDDLEKKTETEKSQTSTSTANNTVKKDQEKETFDHGEGNKALDFLIRGLIRSLNEDDTRKKRANPEKGSTSGNDRVLNRFNRASNASRSNNNAGRRGSHDVSMQDRFDQQRRTLPHNEDLTQNKCIITGVKLQDVRPSPKNYVIGLGLLGKLIINDSDISSVDLQLPRVRRDDTCVMFVVFTNGEIKQKFVGLKRLLPRNLNVMEALDRETLALFNCAKSLKNCGYKSVYPYMGKVFVRKSDYDQPIQVSSMKQIEELRLRIKEETLINI
ncbi:hypothetical protein ACFFRR_010753 [Megaselia abdita]